MTPKPFIRQIREYFNLRPHKEDEQEIVEQINSNITFRGGNLWILMFAILIASLGLNVNSTAVIIGAMLISPLMGPIIGLGFALGTNDLDMLKRAAKNFAAATLISILTATVYWLLTPLSDAQSELLARTSPTLYDVLIAFCGGAAGFIALCTKGKSNVIPGVAIATALMPPLCTAGYGLGTGHIVYFLGAFYLFFINTVFIALATFAGTKVMHFQKKASISPERTMRVRRTITTVVVITMLPAAFMTVNIVQQSIFTNNLKRFVQSELSQNGTQILSNEIDKDNATLRIVAVGRKISTQKQQEATAHMEQYGLGRYTLAVIQDVTADSLLTASGRSAKEMQQQLLELSSQNNGYRDLINHIHSLDTISSEIDAESRLLFNNVEGVTLARTSFVDTGTNAAPLIAIVTAGKPLPSNERLRLGSWLRQRLDADTLRIVYELL